MKKTTNTIIIISSMIIGTALCSCSGDDTINFSSREAFIVSIAKPWVIDTNSEVSINGQDLTSLFSGFKLEINEDLTYTSNSDELSIDELPWPTEGSFTLNENLTELTRHDGLIITIDLSDTDDVLTIEFEGNEVGRTSGIRGRWKCRFRRN